LSPPRRSEIEALVISGIRWRSGKRAAYLRTPGLEGQHRPGIIIAPQTASLAIRRGSAELCVRYRSSSFCTLAIDPKRRTSWLRIASERHRSGGSKILASREEAAQMLSISQRALDYLIATSRFANTAHWQPSSPPRLRTSEVCADRPSAAARGLDLFEMGAVIGYAFGCHKWV
jgi:hypothetical protein